MRKRWLFVAVAMTLVLAVPATVWAVGGSTDAVVDHHAMAWRNSSTSTASATFADVAGLHVVVHSVFGMSVTASVIVSGSPVVFRVTDTSIGGTSNMQPGTVHVTPTGSGTAVTFNWITEGTAAPHDHTVALQWRLASAGGSATVQRGDVDLLYQLGD